LSVRNALWPGRPFLLSTPLTSDPRAEVQALAQALRQATQAESDERARTLVATDATHPFGQTEFTVRALAHQSAAKALTQHLARQKTATSGPV